MNPSNYLTIGKFLNGTKNIINTIDKIIPLYNEVKPMISKIQSIADKLKNSNISDFKLIKKNEDNYSNDNKKKEIKFPSSNPQFFI